MSALRILILLAVVLSAIVSAAGLLVVRGALAIPVTVAGLVVLGVSLLVSGLLLGGSGLRRGREGAGCAGTIVATAGGICLIVGAVALAGAIVLGLLVGTI